jgi:hypothetical protein
MTPDDLEEQLINLGRHWPVPSAADGVLARIAAERRPRRWSPWRRRSAVLALAAVMAIAVIGPWMLLLATPQSLNAQVRQALQKAETAHVVFSMLDGQGLRRQAEIWYARGQGFRAESPEEIILDDGKQQWSWRPQTDERECVIVRRPSQEAAAMITGMFSIANAPAAEKPQRAPAHDRAWAGRACKGYVLTPPTPMIPSPDGKEVIPDPSPPRIVVLVDPDERIVHFEVQRLDGGQWRVGREVSIEYDGSVPEDKLAVRLPRGRVIDTGRSLAERFPLAQARAQVEEGGLLFAIHDVQRGAEDVYLVVSSVRGTAAYLHQHPPFKRRLNLHTVMLDVAIQPAGSVDQDCHRVGLASAQEDGVHYLWWLAAQRQYFTQEPGKDKSFRASPSLEVRPGTVRVPVGANYMNQTGGPYVYTAAEVDVPAASAKSLADLAAEVRRDASLLRQDPTAGISLYRFGGESMRPVTPAEITDGDFADSVRQQLEWLRSFDKITLRQDHR